MSQKKKTVDEYLNEVNYHPDSNYHPTTFALDFVNFIKLVNGIEGEENKTPVFHLKMLDSLTQEGDICNLCFRGSAKTTLFCEYGILYSAVYGVYPGFKGGKPADVSFIMYVSDSIENGVKNLRKNVEFRYEKSDFLKKYLPDVKFTDTRMEFTNASGHKLTVIGYGALTGIRGAKVGGSRPQVALLDDLISDEDAKSATVINDIKNTIYKAVSQALHPTRRKIVWCGTPFNKKDPLYEAVESGAWNVNVFPVCERFPCRREEFYGAWEDRFTYDHLLDQWEKSKANGMISAFNQELMLKILSDDERLVSDSEIQFYDRRDLLKNKNAYNFYITTDFAVTDRQSADFSVISVWAVSYNGMFFWVDGMVKRQNISKTIEELFNFNEIYHPVQVGVEVTGQQQGFIDIIQREMLRRNNFINFASDKNSNRPGIRPNTNKMVRFQNVIPWFHLHKFWFPQDLVDSKDPRMMEFMDELKLATPSGFRSKHDDCIDTISMLSAMNIWNPSKLTYTISSDDPLVQDLWEEPLENVSSESYLV